MAKNKSGKYVSPMLSDPFGPNSIGDVVHARMELLSASRPLQGRTGSRYEIEIASMSISRSFPRRSISRRSSHSDCGMTKATGLQFRKTRSDMSRRSRRTSCNFSSVSTGYLSAMRRFSANISNSSATPEGLFADKIKSMHSSTRLVISVIINLSELLL
jgi:hypothetical protein